MKIIPTILVKNKKEFLTNLGILLPITQNIQIDFMDGKFVKEKSVQPKDIPSLKKYHKHFEAHLMVKNPGMYFTKLKQKGFSKIIFHFESTKNPTKVIDKIKKVKLKVFLAINPETKVKEIFSLLKKSDGILLLAVQPGKSGQKFIRKTLGKIKKIRKLNKTIPIQIDGGINPKTAKKCVKAGATILNTGSFVSEAEDPKEALKLLTKMK